MQPTAYGGGGIGRFVPFLRELMELPPLPPPYGEALREAVEWVLSEFEPVGIVAAGSIVRGRPDATSDIDLCVIHLHPYRQRLQRRFAGVPVETFVNPPCAVRCTFASELENARPVMAHMLASGAVVTNRDTVVSELLAEARVLLDAPPPLTPMEHTARRYRAATWVEDAGDVLAAAPTLASQFAARAVDEMVALRFRQSNLFVPRSKDTLSALAKLDPALHALVERFWGAAVATERYEVTLAAADLVLGVRGFFEWESHPETVPAAASGRLDG